MVNDNPLLPDLEEIWFGMTPYLDELRGARIFLAGGTGVVGTWLLYALLYLDTRSALGLRVYVLSRNPLSFWQRFPALASDSRLSWIKGDARKVSLPKDLVCSHFIHAAADVVMPSVPSETLDVCFSATRNLLAVARRARARRFLFVSSGAVYGRAPVDHEGIVESFAGPISLLDPSSAYAQGKRCAELLCSIESRAGEMVIPIARCFAMVGPFLPFDRHFAIGNFIQSALRRSPLVIRGDGTPVRSYLYLSDVARQLLVLLVAGVNGIAYNIGGRDPVSIAELARLVLATLDIDLPITIMGAPERGAHAHRYYPDTSLIRRSFSMVNDVSLPEAIRRTVSWQSNLTVEN